MAAITNISFSVRVDLTDSPKLVITDTSTHGLSRSAIFSIKQPDGYKREGSFVSPDLSAGESVFSIPLRLDAKGNPQKGNYELVMTVRSSGYDDTKFSRVFCLEWSRPVVVVDKIIDILTPILQLVDSSEYAVAGFSHVFGDRNWKVSSQATGDIYGSGATFLVQKDGAFYSSEYTYEYEPTIVYTSLVNSWLSLHTTEPITGEFRVYSTPTYYDLVGLVSDLRQSEGCKSSCKSKWGDANNLLNLILSKAQSGYTSGIEDDLIDLLEIVGSTTVITNAILLPFGIGGGNSGGASSGSVYGFATNIGNGADSVYSVSHGLNSTDILVNVWDRADKELILCNVLAVTGNSVTLSFDDSVPVDRYRVVIIKI